MRPKYFCSFIIATTVPLNIICGWFGLDVLQENITSVACLVGSGLNSVDGPTDVCRPSRDSNHLQIFQDS